MQRSGREDQKAPAAAPPIEVPDTPKNPAKPVDSSSKSAAEIPKVGTKDAPGG
jgi:hypothetical protein